MATINITNGMSAKQFAARVHSAGLGIDATAVTKHNYLIWLLLQILHLD